MPRDKELCALLVATGADISDLLPEDVGDALQEWKFYFPASLPSDAHIFHYYNALWDEGVEERYRRMRVPSGSRAPLPMLHHLGLYTPEHIMHVFFAPPRRPTL